VQEECTKIVDKEQTLRRKAEMQVKEAVVEVAAAAKAKALAEIQANDAKHALELEVRLCTQLARQKDEVCVIAEARFREDSPSSRDRYLISFINTMSLQCSKCPSGSADRNEPFFSDLHPAYLCSYLRSCTNFEHLSKTCTEERRGRDFIYIYRS
jgi:hypothetical protein